MDLLISTAARMLAAGNPLEALNLVALRNDASALALRGIAMAQLGDFARARKLIRSAARAFGPNEAMARAKCVIADIDIALVSRDLGWPARTLDAARQTLERHGDHVNAAHARYLEARRLLLIGRLDEAECTLGARGQTRLPPALAAAHDLVVAGIAIRRLQSSAAHKALTSAARAAKRAGIPGLQVEVEQAFAALDNPVARLIGSDGEQRLVLHELEALLNAQALNAQVLMVDACHHVVRHGNAIISLLGRPVLFTLARILGEAWPADVSREQLITHAFRMKVADESHRARLRVEMGRLRKVLRPVAQVSATPRGFVLKSRGCCKVVVLARLADEKHASVLALLADGEPWSSSTLALALGASQRTIQRALEALASAGKVQTYGHGRARRWMMPPVPGFTTILLLPTPLPND